MITRFVLQGRRLLQGVITRFVLQGRRLLQGVITRFVLQGRRLLQGVLTRFVLQGRRLLLGGDNPLCPSGTIRLPISSLSRWMRQSSLDFGRV